jgi:hypothetical protein
VITPTNQADVELEQYVLDALKNTERHPGCSHPIFNKKARVGLERERKIY